MTLPFIPFPAGNEAALTVTGAVSLDAATTAWINAVIAAGGTVSGPRQSLVNSLIVDLKADGIWIKLDRLWILAAENTKSALIDLVALATATATGGNFTTDRGYDSSAIDSGFNPGSTPGALYTQDSAHLSVWDNTSGGAAAIIIGISGVSAGVNIYTRYSDNNCYTRINDSPEAGGLAVASTQGFTLGNRSSATARQSYKNGSSLGSLGTVNSTNVPNENILIKGNVTETDQISQFSIGGSLSSTEVTNFYNRLRTYMTAVGVS